MPAFPCFCSTSHPTPPATGLKRAAALKPDPFFTKDAGALITTGGFDTDLAKLASVDWIIEATSSGSTSSSRCSRAEVGAHRTPSCRRTRAVFRFRRWRKRRSPEFARHLLGTHFFNPPRYLRLVEIIPTPQTDPAIVERISTFIDRRLGKGGADEGHAKLHCQPCRSVRRCTTRSRALESGGTNRGNRRHHRARARPPEERHVPHDGHRGPDVVVHVLRNLAERLPEETSRSGFTLPAPSSNS